MDRYSKAILAELERVLDKMDKNSTDRFVKAIRQASRIYIAGVGRSGLVVKAFGQRLMHLGYKVHLADEITAPGISRKDILVCCSGTGETELTIYMAQKAKKIGARVVSITAETSSALPKYSDIIIEIPAPLEHKKERHGISSQQPARSLFEQAMFIYLDSVTMSLMDRLKVTERQIQKRHSNLE